MVSSVEFSIRRLIFKFTDISEMSDKYVVYCQKILEFDIRSGFVVVREISTITKNENNKIFFRNSPDICSHKRCAHCPLTL